MKRPGFFEGVAVALAASLTGGACFAALTTVFPAGLVLKALVAMLGTGYGLYLLARAPERVGRVAAFSLWSAVTAICLVMDVSVAEHLIAQLGLTWVVRSLYFYSSVLPAIADLGLGSLSLAAAVWAATQSASVFLTIWCLFLVQALFVAIPSDMRRRNRAHHEDRFQRAHDAAQTALRRISTVR